MYYYFAPFTPLYPLPTFTLSAPFPVVQTQKPSILLPLFPFPPFASLHSFCPSLLPSKWWGSKNLVYYYLCPLHPPLLPFAPFATFTPFAPFPGDGAKKSSILLPLPPFAPLQSLCPFAPLHPFTRFVPFSSFTPFASFTPVLYSSLWSQVVGTQKYSLELPLHPLPFAPHSLCSL